MFALVGKKIGMSQLFDNNGVVTPVSVIKIEDNIVLDEKTSDKHGYSSAILATSETKEKNLTKPVLGKFKKSNISPRRKIFEVRDFNIDYKINDKFGAKSFEDTLFLDITGFSKGKGTQGVMKRWGFSGGPKTHGSKFHRVAGSTGQCAQPARGLKGVKMAGKMGNDKKTVQNLKLIKIDEENGLLIIKGAVPGRKGSFLMLKKSIKKW